MKIKVVSLPQSNNSDARIIEEYNKGISEGADYVVVSTKNLRGDGDCDRDIVALKAATVGESCALVVNNTKSLMQDVIIIKDGSSEFGEWNGAHINGLCIKFDVVMSIFDGRSRDEHTDNTLYVNTMGYHEQYITDGRPTLVIGGNVYHGRAFIEGGFMFDTEAPETIEEDPNAATYRGLVFGLKEYMRLNKFNSVVLGYSGGVDSGLVAAIACDAIGPENVHLVRLPSKYSSQHSLDDADEGAKRLGAPVRTIYIENTVQAIRDAYSSSRFDLDGDYELTGVADENIQARARAVLLMAVSNQEHRLLLSTGNKSEVAVGYGTLYGDMAGGFNPIKDCYKTLVWELCRWRNSVTVDQAIDHGFMGRGGVDVVPESIITKAPSAELRPDQKDSDSLPDYFELDAQIQSFIETGEAYEKIKKLILGSEFKRRQAAPGIRITEHMFGVDITYPLVRQ